jgi:sugar lactone lactonase YvrE
MKLLCCALMLLTMGAVGPALGATAPAPALRTLAESRESIWNAVAVDSAGRIYVAGPRWTGSRGPSVAVLDATGQPQPYPDVAWNSDDAGVSPAQRFVNVNAIHRDGDDGLWVVDTGVTGFGGTVTPGAAKLVRIDFATRRVTRIYPLGPDIAKAHSYVDDIRFHGRHAYLTDAGEPGLIVMDVDTGKSRRVLETSPSTRAMPGRDIVLDGHVVRAPDGSPLHVNADPLEVSPDGQWFYFAALEGPWWRIATRWLDDASLSDAELQTHLEPWADLPPVGGTTMDAKGNLYFTDLAANAIRRLTPDKQVQTILVDARLHWVDAPTLDAQGRLYLPVPQMDRVALFHGGHSQIDWPIRLYRLDDLRVRTSTP